VSLVGFIKKKFVTMHGHMNLRLHEILKSCNFSKSFKSLPGQLLGMKGQSHAPAALLPWKILPVDYDS